MATSALGAFLILALAGLTPLLGADEPAGPTEEVIRPEEPAPTPGRRADPAPEPVRTAAGTTSAQPAPVEGPPAGSDLFDPPSFRLHPADAGLWSPGSDLQALAFGLAQPSLDGESMRHLLVEHLRRSGFPVPPSSLGMPPEPPSRPHFEANDTLMFTHRLSDVDNDGFDDVAINAFCVTYFCRAPTSGSITSAVPPNDPREGAMNCATPQQLYVKSGRDGKLIWDIDLSRENSTRPFDAQDPVEQFFCPIHIVMGTVPVGLQSMDLAAGELPPTDAENHTAPML